ncbi:MAG: PQQ-dependent sugar dehydrogenase, partial [Myxococcales bacterium]|nr:PQQ-dependent sugar dehydrogenase [Myxococcales bacterium]
MTSWRVAPWILLLSSACSEPGEVVAGGVDAVCWPALPVEEGSGRVLRAVLSVSLAPGLVPGETATYTISGADPGETVILGGSLQGTGVGPCPAQLGGLCVDLVPPLVNLGSAVADGSGVATVTGPVPALPVGTDVAVQAVARRGVGGASSVKSDARTDTVHAPWVSGLASRPANATCLAPSDGPLHDRTIGVQRAFPLLTFDKPVEMLQPPGNADEWWIVEKTGRVWRFADDDATTTMDLVIDLSGVVHSTPQEMGLLGLAFHPDFELNGQVFLSYDVSVGNQLYDEIHRYTSLDGGLTLDPSTEELVLSIPDPYTNHNGGKLAFGWDGYLYYGVGDGGSAGDPGNRAQNTNVLLGKMLRFDVDGGMPYAIPPDNPFAGGGGAPEIYAWGMRNPWRWSFDRGTGDLWVGDVGQNLWEEVDIVELGGNYGWDWKEGFACYTAGCSTVPGLVDPLVSYDPGGAAAIIGGFVYRGSLIPDLVGTYVFADYYTNRIDGIVFDGLGQPSITGLTNVAGFQPSSFAEDADGELYVLEYTNEVWRIVPPVGNPPVDDFPVLLSETGCVDPNDPTLPGPGLIPFEPNSKLWSDDAAKTRWMAIPDGETVTIGPDGDWDFPVGSVLMKEFQIDGHRIETRLLVRHDDGTWAGYAYAWDAGETDATLVEGGATVPTTQGDWRIPSTAECLQCHTQAAGRTLGPRTEQLNRDLDFGGTTGNQVHTLASIGWFTDAPAEHPDLLPALPDPSVPSTVEGRSRSYLDGNCSHCHRPGGPGQGDLDFRYTTADPGGCGLAPTSGDVGVPGSL